ncbi:MAG: NADPH-dependent F420 reductase [Betaproteobacteria bacterium]|nr:NADPH-dependent F420 reductase [Betaproteobacteria bacterium]MDH3437985.1 NADPH-dependent F420 reductase [Betaproteobacteria bacterium]
MSPRRVIGVLGGTGAEGSGLALRWAAAGHEVIIGSRSLEKARAAAQELTAQLAGRGSVRGAGNREAAQAASIVVLAVPYAAQAATAEDVREALQGKILVDVTVPLVPPRLDRVQLPNGESAVLALQRQLGNGVKVVSAFQNVSAVHLKDLTHTIDCDVLVCGDDAQAREVVIEMARDAGLQAWHAGALANSAAVEALTSVLIALNKRYKVPASGIRITGLPEGQ